MRIKLSANTKKTGTKCKKITPEERQQKKVKLANKEKVIAYRKHLLSNALKIPPAINQLKTYLDEDKKSSLYEILDEYKPEDKESKRVRLKKLADNNSQHDTPKPHIIKFGLKHVVDLIERKMVKLVVIAGDVDPIENVIFIPTLCAKLEIPYCVVETQKELGCLVNQKRASVIALCGWNNKHEGKFKNILKEIKAIYNDNYHVAMNTYGGGIILSKAEKETDEVMELQQ